MNPELLEDVLSCPSLPSPPAVAVKVIELTGNENVHVDDLAAVIKTDQGLASKILRTVNSSFYGLRQPCSTIEKALVMLGLGPVKTLALGFSLVSAVEGEKGFDFEAYWRRGLDTAVGAKSIADAAGLDCGDEAFLAGLLHDIGMVALFKALGASYLNILETTDGDHEKLCHAELDAFELQHPEIGAMLAERWKLPEALVIPIRYHARPTASPLEHATLAKLVGAANTAHEVLNVENPDHSFVDFYSRLSDWFDLDVAQADEILRRISSDTKELAKLFNLDAGVSRNPDAMLAEAKQRLAEMTREEPRESYGLGRFEGIINSPQNDPLTGAVNRYGFNELISVSFAEVRDTRNPVSLVTIQVEGIVETARLQGETQADDIVIAAVAALNTHFEPLGGIVCRVGTSSFAVVLPATERAQAARVAEEFRADVEANADAWLAGAGAAGPRIRASAGVATAALETLGAYGTPARFVAASTKALKSARSDGGNAVRAFQPKAAA